MKPSTIFRNIGAIAIAVALSGCATNSSNGLTPNETADITVGQDDERETIWDALRSENTETVVAVNKYLWSASLEVLNFLPVQTVDPFTGVIVTGFGTPPGSGRAYRATVLIKDPALDARSLNVALQTKSGPADAATVRAVENAILSRARQLRIADNKL